MEMEGKAMEHKKEREVLGRKHMDRDNALRKVRKATQALDTAQNQLPPLKASLHAANVDLVALKKEQAKTASSAVELKKDTDILINSFLKEEKKVSSDLKHTKACRHVKVPQGPEVVSSALKQRFERLVAIACTLS